MNQSIATLTATLQKALDSNYDVIDMETVLFVISQLENATITKEQLETTRLAKYINQLRRRTCSEPLARRAKNLIKKWREIFIPQQQSNSSISAAGTSMTSHTQQQQHQSQHQLRSTTHLPNTHDSVTTHGNYLSQSPETPPSNILHTTGVECEDIESSNTSYSQQYQQRYYQQQQQQQKPQQNSSSGYDFHYNSRQLTKQHDLSLPDYPNSNYNRRLNTGSANKRNQAINDSGGDGGGDIGTGSSSTLSQQMHRPSHTTHSQSYDPHERSSKYIKETSLPEHPKNNYNRKSNNTRSANQMEQKSQQQQQQQQHQQQQQQQQQKHLMSNGGGSNLSIDDRLMTGTRTRIKSLKFEKTDTTKDSNSNKSKRNSNKSQPISFANLLPTSTDNSNLQGSVVTHPSFIIDDRSHSPLASSCKSKLSHVVERRSPVLIENSVSPLDFEHNSNQSRDNSIIVSMKNESDSAAMYCSNKLPMINGENRLGSMVELNDYNSNSNLMMNTLDSSIQPSSPLVNLYNNATNCNPDDNETSTEHRKSKKHKKDKKKHKQQQSQKISNLSTEQSVLTTATINSRTPSDYMNMEENYQLSKHSQHRQENMFPPNDSLSNSSLSIFPSTNINTITSSNINNIDGIDDREFNIHVNNKKSDLSFAGKFKNSSSHTITDISQQSQNFSAMNSSIPNAQSNISSVQLKLKKPQMKENDSVVVIESRSCSPFTPTGTTATTVATNSIDSSTSSYHHDVVDLMVGKGKKEIQGGGVDNIISSKQKIITPTLASTRERRGRHAKTAKPEVPAVTPAQQFKSTLIGSGIHNSAPIAGDSGSEHNQQIPAVNADPAVKIPKKRGRKKRLKTTELPPSNPGNFLNSQLFENSRLLSISTLTTNKKVKTTKELLADIQNRKLESAASSPTLIHSQSSRVPSPCSEVSLHSPSTSDACSTNATISTIARFTPDLQSNLVDTCSEDIIDSASDSNTTPGINTINSQKSVKNLSSQTKKDNSSTKTDDFFTSVPSITLEKPQQQQSSSLKRLKTVDDEIEALMNLLPPVDRSKIQWNNNNELMCSCYVITSGENQENNEGQIKVDFSKDEEHLSVLTATSPMVVLSPGNATLVPIISASPAVKSLKSLSDENSISILLSSSKQQLKTPLTSPCSKSCSSISDKMISSRKPPIKSIFDLDYDEDDDPLNSIVEAANNPSLKITSCTKPKDDYKNDDDDDGYGYDDVKMNKKSNKCIEYTDEYNNEANDDDIYNMIKIKKKAKKVSKQNASKSDIIDNSTSSSSQQSITAAMLQSLEQQQQQFSILANTKSSLVAQTSQFPHYEAIEDVNCLAKNLYVTQRNKITLYHINSLHNRFIPNVNGNWDNSGIITTKTTTTATSDFMIVTDEISGSRLVKICCDDDEINPDGLYKRVVPQYNHIIMDKIPKDLSHIEFTKNYKIKKFNKHNMNNNNKIKNNRLQFNTFSSELTLFNGADANINQNHIEEIDDDNDNSDNDESNDDENDLTLHKHIKRKRLNLKEADDKLMLENCINDFVDENKKDVSMPTINLDDDNNDDNVVETNRFNISIETSNNNVNNTKNNSNENIEKNDVIILDEDDNNRDNNNDDHIMKGTENVLTIKLDTDDDDDDDDFDVVNNEELITNKLMTINNEVSIINDDDNDKIITIKIIKDQKEGEEGKHEIQDDYDDDEDEGEQIKGQKINNKDFLNDKSVSRRRRNSSCSSSSSNNNDSNNFNNHNINLNNNNDNENISDNIRNFINNKNENNDDVNDNLNNIPCSAVIDKSNNSNINNNNNNDNKNNNNDNCLNEDNYVDDNNSMENDNNQQQLSRNSMLSNYLGEEKYHDDDECIGNDNNYDDDDDDDDDDDRDFNDEDDGGGDASSSSDFHHQIVTHDMTSSTSTTSQKHIVLTIKKTPVDNNSRHQQQSQEQQQQQQQQLQPQQTLEQHNNDDFLMLSPENIFSSPSPISVTPNNTANNNSISNVTTKVNADNDLGNTTKDKCKGNMDNGNNFGVISENNIIKKSLLNNDDDNDIDKIVTTVTSEINTILINDACLEMKMNENDLMISNNKSYDMAVSSVNSLVAYNDNNEGDKKDVINNYDDNHTSSIMNNSKKINKLKRKYHDENDDYNTTDDINNYKMMTIDSIDYDDNDDHNNKDKNNSEYNSVCRYYHYNRNNNDDEDNNSSLIIMKNTEKSHDSDNDCYDDNDSNDTDEYNTDSLPIENNGFLKSFNNLTEENRTGIRKIKKQDQQQLTTTNAVNNSKIERKLERALTNDNGNNNNINNSNSNRNCNNSNSNVNINNNTSNIINLVDNNQDENEQEEQQFQQFKEWYEVHQVHSYNDELLTILPYVVID